MTRCNYCELKEIFDRIKASGGEIAIVTLSNPTPGGFDVYSDHNGERKFQGWFLSYVQHCTCMATTRC